MSKSFVVNVPVSPYILKFATLRYGYPIKLDNSTLLSGAIISLLGKENFNTRMPLHKKNLQYKHYIASLQFVAPISIMRNLGFSLTHDQAIQVNRHLEADFEERLHIYVAQNINSETRRCGYQKAVEQFAAFYGIDIDRDISLDGLMKIQYRYRIRQQKKADLFVSTLSTQNRQLSMILL